MAFKNYLSALDDLPDVLCIQESHLTPKYHPSIPHYQVIRKDRPLSKGIAVHGFSIFNIYNPPPTPWPPPPLIFYPTLQKLFSVVIFTLTTGCGEAITQTVVEDLW